MQWHWLSGTCLLPINVTTLWPLSPNSLSLSLSFHSSFSFFDSLLVNQCNWNYEFSQIANIPCKSIANPLQHVATLLLWKQLQLSVALHHLLSWRGQPTTSFGSYLHVIRHGKQRLLRSYATLMLRCYTNPTWQQHNEIQWTAGSAHHKSLQNAKGQHLAD